MAGGSLTAAAALLADRLGLGDGGIGALQLALLFAGLGGVALGTFLLTSPGQAYLAGWRRILAADRQPASILVWAICLGLLSGWAQVAVQFVRRNLRHEILGMGLDYPWLLPLAQLSLFLLLGAVLTVVHRRWPSRITRGAALGLLAFVAFLSLLLLVRHIYVPALVILALGLGLQTGRWLVRHPGRDPLARWAVGWPALLRKPPAAAPPPAAPLPARLRPRGGSRHRRHRPRHPEPGGLPRACGPAPHPTRHRRTQCLADRPGHRAGGQHQPARL